MIFSSRYDLLSRIQRQFPQLTQFADVEEAFTVAEAYEIERLLEDRDGDAKDWFKFVVTGNIDRYESTWGYESTKYLKHDYVRPSINKDRFRRAFPKRYAQATSNKIVIAGIRHFECFVDSASEYIPAKSTVIVRNYRNGASGEYLAGILNSSFMTRYLAESYGTLAMDAGINFTAPMLSKLPIPAPTKNVDPIEALVERMAALNHEKRVGEATFLSWLEAECRCAPSDEHKRGIREFVGSARLLNFLGDYRKGETPLEFGDLWEILEKNRKLMHARLDQTLLRKRIKEKYQTVLKDLSPIKTKLARIDKDIDDRVCRLYGLSDAELEQLHGGTGITLAAQT